MKRDFDARAVVASGWRYLRVWTLAEWCVRYVLKARGFKSCYTPILEKITRFDLVSDLYRLLPEYSI